ncbi:hypothetical protein Tco_0379083 [Tanacetum coccineum]
MSNVEWDELIHIEMVETVVEAEDYCVKTDKILNLTIKLRSSRSVPLGISNKWYHSFDEALNKRNKQTYYILHISVTHGGKIATITTLTRNSDGNASAGKTVGEVEQEYEPTSAEEKNKEEIETISLDDLYNNLKIYKPELTGSSSTNQNPQNMAFVSSNSNNNSNTNEVDNTAFGVSTAHTQSNPTSGDNLSDAVIYAFLASQPNSP